MAVLIFLLVLVIVLSDLASTASIMRWIGDAIDAGDWVAMVAAIVAVLSFWQSRRSANAAEAALPIAEKSAEAAFGSADAAARSARVAEREWSSKNAPKWHIELGPVSGGYCQVRATLLWSPGPVVVTGSYMSTAWTVYSDDERSGSPWIDPIERRGGLVTGDLLEYQIPLPPGSKVDEVELRITLVSFGTEPEDSTDQQGPWSHDEALLWTKPVVD